MPLTNVSNSLVNGSTYEMQTKHQELMGTESTQSTTDTEDGLGWAQISESGTKNG